MIHPTPMQDEIVEKSSWPTIRSAYKGYEATYVILHPFLKIKPGCDIKFETGNWPTKEQIIRCTDKLTWAEIINEAELIDIKELDRLLAYLHCARETADKTAWQKLMQVVGRKDYVVPQVDFLPEIITNSLFESIKALGYGQVSVFSEFGDFERNYDINEIIMSKERVLNVHARVATPDNRVLIATDFDQRFSYLSSTKELLNDLIQRADLEGFYCDEATRPDWSYIEQKENIIDWKSPERYKNYA
jgi:hypothetical protein